MIELDRHKSLDDFLLIEMAKRFVGGRKIVLDLLFIDSAIRPHVPQGNQLVFADRFGIRNFFELDLNVVATLQFSDAPALVHVDERNGNTGLPGTGRATAAVCIGRDFVGKLVMNHVRDVVDVDTARGHIGRHENGDVFLTELAHDRIALGL